MDTAKLSNRRDALYDRLLDSELLSKVSFSAIYILSIKFHSIFAQEVSASKRKARKRLLSRSPTKSASSKVCCFLVPYLET